MNLYVEVFGTTSLRDIEIYKTKISTSRTFEQIGVDFGITRQRAEQIFARTNKKIERFYFDMKKLIKINAVELIDTLSKTHNLNR